MKKKEEKNILNKLLIPSLILIIVLLIILIVIIVFKNNNDFNKRLNEAGYITTEEALKSTLDDLDLSRSDVKDLDIELTYKYNKDVYEINFKYQDYEYEYYVDANKGDILKSFKEKDDDVIIDNKETEDKNNNGNSSSNNTTSNNTTSNNSTSNNSTSNNSTTSKNYISRDKALSIAVSHAKVNQNNIYDIDIELDYKYGQEVYEIDFNYQGYEYQYYIDALKGDILHSFKERD